VVGLPGANGNFVDATVFDAPTLGGRAALAVGTNRMVLDALDVLVPSTTRGIIAAGDSITDGANSTPDTHTRWSDVLAERLVAADTTSAGRMPPAVSHAGIGGNRVVTDAAAQFGPNLVSRFERDVLSRSGVTDVIVLEGVNDIGQSATFTETTENIIAAYRTLIQRTHTRGLKIYFGTITPIRSDEATAAGTFGGLFSQSQVLFDQREPRRQAVKQWILTTREHDGAIDFNAALSARGVLNQIHAPYTLNPISGSNDQLHPNSTGYRAMANHVNLSWFSSQAVPDASNGVRSSGLGGK
jgi:lysophospholipase L1-like esterase